MKYYACAVSAAQTAGAKVITTRDSLFYGISGTGSAAACTVTVHPGIATGTTPAFFCTIPATAAGNNFLNYPVVCAGGITTTNVGTLVKYVVYYAYAQR